MRNLTDGMRSHDTTRSKIDRHQSSSCHKMFPLNHASTRAYLEARKTRRNLHGVVVSHRCLTLLGRTIRRLSTCYSL